MSVARAPVLLPGLAHLSRAIQDMGVVASRRMCRAFRLGAMSPAAIAGALARAKSW